MYYLIDYENVNEHGLRGCEYLTPDDKLIIFYNVSNCQISNEAVDKIFGSGCGCECCKLVKSGNNALDFYICTKVGELLGGGEKLLAIISDDKGYRAVRDYWTNFGSGQRIILQSSVENAIVELNLDKETVNIIKHRHLKTSIDVGVEKITLINELWKIAEERFTKQEFYNNLNCVLETDAAEPHNKRKIYLECLRRFGKDGGIKIYNRLKASSDKIDLLRQCTVTHVVNSPELTKQRINEALKDIVTDSYARDIIAEYVLEDTSREQVNNFIMKKYKGKKGGKIMITLKPFIKGKRGQ